MAQVTRLRHGDAATRPRGERTTFTGKNAYFTLIALSVLMGGSMIGQSPKPLRFEISFPASLRSSAVDGRVFVIISTKKDKEPRMQIGESLDTQQFFGMDAEGLGPGHAAVIDESAQGYPRDSLRDVPDGEYYVQALINVYETFHRADGHTLKFHMDQGEGQRWNVSPGNLMSEPRKLHINRSSSAPIKIELTKIIPPIAAAKGYEVRQTFSRREQAAIEILGPSDVHRRRGAFA